MSNPIFTKSRVSAVLGPTNTGKTHLAIERMLEYRTGCIGFPLRLLARENYDRVVGLKGKAAVALVTGEEKIIPPHARYFLCTVEAMPVDQAFEFLAIDEIQLCADPDRGHVFTDRLLRARGIHETMVMGADTAGHLLKALVPGVDIIGRERLSTLAYTGFKKLTRLPKRSAVVAFSVDDVYAFAELVRRTRGGTAVVLGALSPRTRNAQVGMYQAGEVDFMVATDAIGMGLNMDIHHVALAATRKFDGSRARPLTRAEIGQIAGRAGRYKTDGTFGTTGPVIRLEDEVIEAVEQHEFESLKIFYWRNSDLDFKSPARLLKSLEIPPSHPVLLRGRPSDDYLTLAALAGRDEVLARCGAADTVRLLWDVCQIPDFRRTLSETHQELAAGVFEELADTGRIADARIEAQLERLDRTDGDVDTLMARIAHVRTWTYITHKAEWLDRDGEAWAARALGIEDRLSDALHESLLRRFVDRRSAVLLRAMEAGGALLAGVRQSGEVIVEGHEVGRLHGFRFEADEGASGLDYRAVMAAARNALKPELQRRLKAMLTAEPKQFKLADDGQITYQADATNPLPGQPAARIRKGEALLKPEIDLLDADLLDGQDRDAVAAKVKDWLHAHIDTVLEPLTALAAQEGEGVDSAVRGISFQLHEALGIRPRADLESLIADLTPDSRKALRARRIRLGPVLAFIPDLNKPAAVRLRAILWTLWHDKPLPAATPQAGTTSFKVDDAADREFHRAVGYPVYGPRAIRVDMLDRVISAVYDSAKDGTFKAEHKMAEWLGCPIADLYAVLEAMGHVKISDPADAVAPASLEAAPELTPAPDLMPAIVEDAPPPAIEGNETAGEAIVAAAAEDPIVDAAAVQATDQPVIPPKAPQVRPELATFRLRRGRAYGAPPARPGRAPRPPKTGEPQPARFNRGETGHHGGHNDSATREERPVRTGEGKPSNRHNDRGRERDDRRPARDAKAAPRDREERVVSAGPKFGAQGSPFAILQTLKDK